MGLSMNYLVKKLVDKFRGRSFVTPTSTNLNVSPRQASINEPRTAKFSDASATRPNSNFIPLQKGGSVVARGNKLARSKPTKLY